MRRLGIILLSVLALLAIAFVFLRTPDTDQAAMRTKYGGPPSQFVMLDSGLTVHLRDEGPRGAPVIILLHGSNADLQAWQPWTERLSDRYRIIRFDQLGHGLTGPAPDGDYSTAAFVKSVDQLADTLGLEKFVIGGNSMGGGIALSYTMAHPERINGLILVDAFGAPVEQTGSGNIGFKIAGLPVVNQLITQITPRAIIKQSLSQSVSNQAIVTPQTVDRYWELLRYPGNREATLARFAQARTPFDAADVGQVKVPVLIIWGQEDTLIPFAAANWFAENLQNSVSISYPGIGHFPMEEAPEKTAAALRQWLGEHTLATNSR